MSEIQHTSQEAGTQQKKDLGSGKISIREGVVSPIFQSIKTFFAMHAAVLKPELASQVAQQGGKESDEDRRREQYARERNAEATKTTPSLTGTESPAQLLEMYTRAQGQLTEAQLKEVRTKLEALSTQRSSQSPPSAELPKAA